MSGLLRNFVGVLDSGVGGLTVLRQLVRQYPCNYVYLADGAYCPYGTMTHDKLYCRLQTVMTWFVEQGATAVVIACNTASIFADALRAQFNIPIYDVVTPTCDLVATVTQTKRVALLATDSTVQSDIYGKKLAERAIVVTSFACSAFVPFVESAQVDASECKKVVGHALDHLPEANADTVILGCTHFPLLAKQISKYVGDARLVQCVTDFVPAENTTVYDKSNAVFLTTGCDFAAKRASLWYGRARFVHVDIQ